MQEDGGVRITGEHTTSRSQSISAVVPSLKPGRTYSTSGSLDGISLWVKFFAGGSTVSEVYGDKTFTVPSNAETMFCGIVVESTLQGQQIDETVYPMLVEGLPTEYVPYALGGSVLTNLWVDSGKLSSPDGLSVTRLDDGGYRIVGDGAGNWATIMEATAPIGDIGVSAGDAMHMSWGDVPRYSGGLELIVVQVDADMSFIGSVSQETNGKFVIAQNAAYLKFRVALSSARTPIDCTVYPMLAKSDEPVDYYVPYVVGGGIPELWPEYEAQTVSGVTIEPAEGGYRVHGTATAYANIWVNAQLEAGAAYLASVSSTSPDVYAQVYRSDQTVVVKDGAPQRFEAVGGEYYLYVKVDAGKTVDAIARPSLMRIGDAGGGIANLVGSEDGLFVNVATGGGSIDVTPDGVHYAITNDWAGCFFVYDLPAGTYRAEKDGCRSILASIKVSGAYNKNGYYSEQAGADIYTSSIAVGSDTISLPGDGKIGFVLPHGEGVAHPSIVRVL